MQISIMEISMSLNGNLVLSWGITQPTEKIEDHSAIASRLLLASRGASISDIPRGIYK